MSEPASMHGEGNEPLSKRVLKATLSTPVLFGCHLLAVYVFCYLSIHVVSHYLHYFYTRDTLLPAVTRSVYDLHLFMTDFWYLFVLPFLLVDGALLLFLGMSSGKLRAMRQWLFSGVLMLIVVGIGWILFAISLPIDFPEKSNWSPPASSTPSPPIGPTVDRVRKIISDQLGTDIEKVKATTTLGELGADELDIVELIMEFEETFEIRIPDERLELLGKQQGMNRVTVEKLAELIDSIQQK